VRVLTAALTRLVALGWRCLRRIRPGRPAVLIVDGDPWLRSLMSSAAVAVRPRDPRRRRAVAVLTGPGGGHRVPARSADPRQFGYRAGIGAGGVELDPAPLVAVDAVVRRRRIDGAPADVRALHADARRPIPPVPVNGDQNDLIAYLDRARAAHSDYRAAYRRTSLDVLSAMGIGVRSDVTVLCVTNRPHLLANVIDNFLRQSNCEAELLVVTHGEHCSDEAAGVLSGVDGARQLAAPGDVTLGACLNLGLADCRTRYVAKFDDDDFYGADYLTDALLSARASSAAVVGKHSYFVHLEGQHRTLLRFPGRECRPTTYLAGGTMFLDRERLGDMWFPDLTVGEDQGLIRRCLLRGRGVYAGDMFNYLQHRGSHNTWVADDAYLSRNALDAGSGAGIDIVVA
jgi:hypothetical protein